MFKAFGVALLVLLLLYALLTLNNRRAARRGAPRSPSGRQTVPATFVMRTVDAHNSANHDDVLVFALDDGTRLQFSVADAAAQGWTPGGRGLLAYNARPGAPEWISFTPDRTAAPAEPVPQAEPAPLTSPATVVRVDAAQHAALFELPDGSRVRLSVPPVVLPLLREGLSGQLTWQDRQFTRFTPDP